MNAQTTSGPASSKLDDFRRTYARLVVVSNRLPITLDSDGSVSMSSGGLVTALSPVLQKQGGVWLGWPGTDEDLGKSLASFSKQNSYELEPVLLNQSEVDAFYYGFSNEVLWPLFHGFHGQCRFEPGYWQAYKRVNRKFAEKIAEVTDRSDYIWIHDYHLLLVAQKLKKLGLRRDCGFYLHIPFPSPDTFLKLPWRREVLAGMLEFDFLGFQTDWDLENFRHTVQALDSLAAGRPGKMSPGGRSKTKIHGAAVPISIDFAQFADSAESFRRDSTSSPWTGLLKAGGKTLLGLDRLDYTKGIPERLLAYRQLLLDYPEHRGRTTFLQVVVPSRERIDAYKKLKEEIERLVAEINGQFATPEWTPIHYLHRSLSHRELIFAYLQADVAVVTPLRDGMNLVAKEYCACKTELNGVLILSEFAGASLQLREGALLVNPYDIRSLARILDTATRLPRPEREARMLIARESIRSEDNSWWLESFLNAAVKQPLPLGRRTKASRLASRQPRERRIGMHATLRQAPKQAVSFQQKPLQDRWRRRQVRSRDKPQFA